jgi:hypothetical protein
VRKLSLKAVLIPPGIGFRSKEYRSLIVVDAVNIVAGLVEMSAHFAASQSG